MNDDDRYIWFEVDEDAVMRGLNYQEELAQRRLKQFLDRLARKGEELLESRAPRHTGYTKRHVDHTPARFDGRDEYMAIVGVKDGTSYHPVYANVGTGLYGKYNDYVQSPKGNLMYFYASRLGHVISMYLVKGQKPQQYLYESWRDLAIYAEARMMMDSYFT